MTRISVRGGARRRFLSRLAGVTAAILLLPLAGAGTARATKPAKPVLCPEDECGYRYDPRFGDPEAGIPPGTAFEDLPDDWECPECGTEKRHW